MLDSDELDIAVALFGSLSALHSFATLRASGMADETCRPKDI